MVNEDTCQLISDSFLQKDTNNRWVNPTWESKKDFTVTNCFTDLCNLHIYEVSHWPVTFGTTDTKSKVFQDIITIYRVTNFWVELDTVEVFLSIFHCGEWAIYWVTNKMETFWNFCNCITVAHKNNLFFRSSCKEFWLGTKAKCWLAILTVTCFTSWNNFTTKFVGQKLHSVTDTKNWNTKFQNLFVNTKWIFGINRVRTTRKYDTDRIDGTDFISGNFMALQFRENTKFTNTTCNQLIVLATIV